MSNTLTEIAQRLKDANKKVQLIYAFNGTGKTRLSREFKALVAPKHNAEGEETDQPRSKILYYNAFTEDLFYWDNDLAEDAEPKLKIQPNSFTDWVLEDQGQDQNIIKNFQRYSSDKLTPHFNAEYTKNVEKGQKISVKAFSEVTFSLERGNDEHFRNLKISKGEESCFIWSIFYALLEQAIEVLNIAEPSERATHKFDRLEYVFIDDPVSSLDENHLIELAVDLAQLIKSSTDPNVKFIITTHNPLFYNVICNELSTKNGYILDNLEDGTFALLEKKGDSNTSFSYHLHIMHILEQAIAENTIEKYHFTLLRNLYEKTASFLGYPRWSELLPDDRQLYLNRIIQFTSHSTLSHEAVAVPTAAEKATVKFLLDHLQSTYSFWRRQEKEKQHD